MIDGLVLSRYVRDEILLLIFAGAGWLAMAGSGFYATLRRMHGADQCVNSIFRYRDSDFAVVLQYLR